MLKLRDCVAAVAATLCFAVGDAQSQEMKIGLTGTFTGPNASNGIPYRNAAEVFPEKLGGLPVKWIILDDGGDVTTAVKNARRFVDTDKVDAIVGSTSTPTAAALFDVANSGATPQIAMSPVNITDAVRPFVFSVPQPVSIMIGALVDDMKKRGVKKAAFIGFADGWGDLTWGGFSKLAGEAGIQIVASERYNRTDTSVTAQILKIVSAAPDAVFIGASTLPAILPHATLKDQGFNGSIYHTHGVVSQAFISNGGKALEGAIIPAGPMVVAYDLPDSNPIKAISLDMIKRYQARWGSGPVPAFAGYAWDGMLMLDAAATEAAKKAKPGTPEFRLALRDALQSGKDIAGTNAVYRFTSSDHYGVDERARVLITIKDGAFRLLK